MLFSCAEDSGVNYSPDEMLLPLKKGNSWEFNVTDGVYDYSECTITVYEYKKYLAYNQETDSEEYKKCYFLEGFFIHENYSYNIKFYFNYDDGIYTSCVNKSENSSDVLLHSKESFYDDIELNTEHAKLGEKIIEVNNDNISYVLEKGKGFKKITLKAGKRFDLIIQDYKIN